MRRLFASVGETLTKGELRTFSVVEAAEGGKGVVSGKGPWKRDSKLGCGGDAGWRRKVARCGRWVIVLVLVCVDVTRGAHVRSAQ